MLKLSRPQIAVGVAAGLAFGLAVSALSQEAATPAPPSWQTLVRCAQMGDDDDRLGCYDDAMRAAGFAPRPEAVAQARRRLFGLTVPQLNILKGKPNKAEQEGAGEGRGKHAKRSGGGEAPKEDQDNITVVLAKIASQGDGRLLFITSDGQIWEQTETEPVAPWPKEGYAMPIHRNRLGGYFCDVSRFKEVRCRRVR